MAENQRKNKGSQMGQATAKKINVGERALVEFLLPPTGKKLHFSIKVLTLFSNNQIRQNELV